MFWTVCKGHLTDIGGPVPAGYNPNATEIYAASLLAIDPDGAAEQGYLALLAARLHLDPGLVDHLHARARTLR